MMKTLEIARTVELQADIDFKFEEEENAHAKVIEHATYGYKYPCNSQKKWISGESLVEYLGSYWKGLFDRGEFDKAGAVAAFKCDIENQLRSDKESEVRV